jgi:glutamine amidotransferase
MILIANYGMGNLGSIANMIKKVGGKAEITSDADRIAQADKIILPGVGAFDHGMTGLKQSGLLDSLSVAVLQRGVPVLGVCLGMQLMLESSEEGNEPGLGWIAGRATRFPQVQSSLKVPHMGWNVAVAVKDNPLLDMAPEVPQRYYFVHSYKVECTDPSDELAVSEYGVRFCSAFARENIYGVQFHPEKSHIYGMSLFRRFVEL